MCWTARCTCQNQLRSIDLFRETLRSLRSRDLIDCRADQSSHQGMRDMASLVETYLAAERDLVEAVDAASGAVPMPDGRTITVGRSEFDALPSGRRKRAWVIIRKNAPVPPRR
jgi:hypothetical protein